MRSMFEKRCFTVFQVTVLEVPLCYSISLILTDLCRCKQKKKIYNAMKAIYLHVYLHFLLRRYEGICSNILIEKYSCIPVVVMKLFVSVILISLCHSCIFAVCKALWSERALSIG